MKRLTYLNGEVLPTEQAKVNVADHAHLYGDGIFEGIRIYDGLIFKLDEHLDRLMAGAHAMDFRMTKTKEDIKAIIVDTCRQADAYTGSGYIRLNLTRGTGLGLDPDHIDATPNLMVMVGSLSLYTPEMYEKGLDMVTVSTRLIPPVSLDGRLKTIGRYCSNIQAKLEANRHGAGEGLLLTTDGFVGEGTGDNIFAIKNGKVSTPPAHIGILGGITRLTVINLCKDLGIEIEERMMTMFDLYSADELFLTGTAAEVISSCSLDGRTIGNGKPGAVTKKISAAFREKTKTDGTRI